MAFFGCARYLPALTNVLSRRALIDVLAFDQVQAPEARGRQAKDRQSADRADESRLVRSPRSDVQ